VNVDFAAAVLSWGVDQLSDEEVDELFERVYRCVKIAEGS